MNAYCDRQSVELNSIAFLFDGRRLRAEQTPDEVDLFSFCYVSIFFTPTHKHLDAPACRVNRVFKMAANKLVFCFLSSA